MNIDDLVGKESKESLILKSLPPEEEARLLGVIRDVIDERFRTLETGLRQSLLVASERC
ncbi:Uncharacterised protein [Yersinia massiliensis]|nr:Uncharacterised protein [Yersinia massiliensis]